MCYNPITIKAADGVHEMKVPCGHCLACLKAYQQMWVARLEEERKSWRTVDGKIPIVFFTLTYSEENIPKNYLHLSTTGVHLAKENLFPNLPVIKWNTTLREPEKDAKDRQLQIELDWQSDLATYVDKYHMPVEEAEFEQDTFDIPAWMFDEQSMPVGTPLHSPISFNTVRYSDVRNWIKACRVYASRFLKPIRIPSLREEGKTIPCNPLYVSEIDGHRLPDSAIPAQFKYFICSEYGPRTLRPHYHGVLFGVTIDQFDRYFKPLWENRFGHVESSAFDSTKGGMLYVSKYCAKGSYDNPLSKKDFFYPNGREYHSKKYEGSLLRFGLNIALSDPCFRLMSHGFGLGYVFRESVQKYWKVAIDSSFVTRSSMAVLPLPSVGLDENPNSPLFCKHSTVYKTIHYGNPESLFDSRDIRFVADGYRNFEGFVDFAAVEVRNFDSRGRLISETIFDAQADACLELEDSLISRRYARTYSYHPKGAQKGTLVTSVAESALPKYYHRWLLPPSSKLYISSAAIRRDALDAADKWRQVELAGPSDQKIVQIGELERLAALEQSRSIEVLRKSADRFYSRFDPEDLKDARLPNR